MLALSFVLCLPAWAVEESDNGKIREQINGFSNGLSEGLTRVKIDELAGEGRHQEAIEVFESMETLDIPARTAHVVINSCREIGRTDLAIRVVDHQIELLARDGEEGPASGAEAHDPEKESEAWRIRKAQLLLDKGQPEEAAGLLDSLHKDHRESGKWLNLRIMAARDSGNPYVQLRFLREKLEKQEEPDPALAKQIEVLEGNARFHRIDALAAEGRHAEVIEAFLELDTPDIPDYAAHAVVNSCRELGRTELGMDVVEHQLLRLAREKKESEGDGTRDREEHQDLRGRTSAWRLRKAQILMDMGEHAQAAILLDDFPEEEREDNDWRDLRIYAAREIGEDELLLSLLEEKAESQETPDPELEEQLAALSESSNYARIATLSEEGRHMEAVELFESLDTLDIPDHTAHAVVNSCREIERTELAVLVVDHQLAVLTEKLDENAAIESPDEDQAREAQVMEQRFLAWRLRMVRLQLDQKKPGEAAAMLDFFPEEERGHPDWLDLRYTAAREAGGVEEAIEWFESQDARDLPEHTAHAVVNDCRELGRTELAMEVTDRQLLALDRMRDGETADENRVSAHDSKHTAWRLRKAQLLLDAGDPEEAAALLGSIPEENREGTEWVDLRMASAWEAGDTETFEKYAKEHPELAEKMKARTGSSPRDRVVALSSEGRHREALEAFQSLDTLDIPEYVALAVVHSCRELGRTEQAAEVVDRQIVLQMQKREELAEKQVRERGEQRIDWRIHKARLLLDRAESQEASELLDSFSVDDRDNPEWLDLRITAAWETGDTLALVRYTQEKFESQETPDPDLLTKHINGLIELGAAHAAERLLRESRRRQQLVNFDETDLTDGLGAVELHWSGLASPTMHERIERAERVIRRIDRHGYGPALPRKLAYLRVVALRNAQRWEECVEDYHRLEDVVQPPVWVTAAAASSYLSLRAPEKSKELFKLANIGEAEQAKVDGLFYSLVEVEDYQAVFEWIDDFEKAAPYRRQISLFGDEGENWHKLDLRRMAVNARHYGNQLTWAWNEVERLRQAAPANQHILEDHAALSAARGWHHLASNEYRVAIDRNPESAQARKGLGQSRLALHDPREAKRQLDELQTRHPLSHEYKDLLHDWETYHLWEHYSDVSFYYGDGPEIGGFSVEHNGELYTPPFGLGFAGPYAHQWRAMMEWRAAHAKIVEGRSELFYAGAGLQFRYPHFEVLARAGHAEHERGDTVAGRFRADWKPDDHWRVRGEYDTFDPSTPLRALWHGVESDRKALTVTHRAHESREISVSAEHSDFSDGNERQELSGFVRQRFIDVPHLDVDAIARAGYSRNSLGGLTPYWNPEEDLSLSLGFVADHVLWRRYEWVWTHHLHGDIGLYDQNGFDADWTASLGYRHRWQVKPYSEFSAGIAAGRRVYDGEGEPFVSGDLTLHARF